MTPGILLARISNGACVCHWCRNRSIDTDQRWALIVGGVFLTDPFCHSHCALRDAEVNKRGPIVFHEAA